MHSAQSWWAWWRQWWAHPLSVGSLLAADPTGTRPWRIGNVVATALLTTGYAWPARSLTAIGGAVFQGAVAALVVGTVTAGTAAALGLAARLAGERLAPSVRDALAGLGAAGLLLAWLCRLVPVFAALGAGLALLLWTLQTWEGLAAALNVPLARAAALLALAASLVLAGAAVVAGFAGLWLPHAGAV